MIASIFGKSKPVNLVIVSVFVIVFVGGSGLGQLTGDFFDIAEYLINLGLLIFILFLLDFINSKNNITSKNSYLVLWFGLFLALIPNTVHQTPYLWSNIFILLAVRRLLSLHSNRHIKKKVFDATLWISVAAIFNPWAILFLFLVVIAIIYFSGNDFKTILVPFSAIFCLLILKVSYNVVFYDSYVLDSDFEFQFSFNPSGYKALPFFLLLLPFLLIVAWSSIKLLFSIKDRNAQSKPIYILIFWWIFPAFLVSFFSKTNDGGEFIYALAPAAFVVALNIETIDKPFIVNGSILFLLALSVLGAFL